MHSDILQRSREIRGNIQAPSFPLEAIHAAASRTERPARRGPLVAAVIAGCSIVAIAATAQVVQHTQLRFMPSGGVVISSDRGSVQLIHNEDAIRAASERLDFPATLPAGLPANASPLKLDTAGTSLLTITYALPNARHLWIMLVNPRAISGSLAPSTSRRGKHIRAQFWRVGSEGVLVASDGLTSSQFAAIKRAMERAAST